MTQMHDDELSSDAALVEQLINEQFPHWSGLAIRPVSSTGTSNAMYRLGPDMAVRLPLRPGSEPSLRKEMRWLPELAPHVPLSVPVPLAIGEPTPAFSSAWAVVPWLDGVDGSVEPTSGSAETARALAAFIAALHSVPVAADAPSPSARSSDRGGPLAPRDAKVRRYAAAARHLTDVDAVLTVWEESLAAPVWAGDSVWIHGDIAAGNLLFVDGTLSASIDWSPMAVGDPAADLLVAWEMFGPDARKVFRTQIEERAPYRVDEAMWLRARGWAVSTAIMALPYYEHTNAFMVDQAQRKIAALLAAH